MHVPEYGGNRIPQNALKFSSQGVMLSKIALLSIKYPGKDFLPSHVVPSGFSGGNTGKNEKIP